MMKLRRNYYMYKLINVVFNQCLSVIGFILKLNYFS